jgi:hypothetical protein
MTLRGLPPRLRWFIVVVATAGIAASAAVILLDPGHWDRSVWPRLAVLLVLTAASEIAGLRLPHRGALEMLNLYEGMVVANIALLPAGQAIAVSLAGLLVAQVVQRRAPVKAVFNLGMYATALAPAIGLYHLVAGDAGLLSARGMTAMAVAIAIFALVNLLLISQLLAVIEDRPLWDVVQESSKLSILIFLGNSAVGLIGVVLWLREPVALPAVLLPAATLWLAYRSAERQMQERDRFQHLYEVGQAFASSLVLEEVLPNVLPKVARLFGAEEAHLLFAQGAGRPFGAIHGPDGFRFGPADPADLTALALLGEGTSPVVGRPGQAPEGWRELLVAPLVAQGRHLGVIVLGNLRHDRHTGGRGHAARPPGPPAALPPGLGAGRHPRQRHPGRPDQGGEVDPGADPRALLGRHPAAGRQGPGPGLEPGHGADLRGGVRRRGRPALQRAAGRTRPRRQAGPAGGPAGRSHPGQPPGLGRGADPHLRGPGAVGCAATTRCCTRAGSGPPTW